MAKGFFETENNERKRTHKGRKQGCYSCGRYRKCSNPQIGVIGGGKKKILIINDHPTKKEDDLGEFDIEDKYEYLQQTLEMEEINLQEDCWYTFAARCYYTEYRKGKKVNTQRYLNACRQKLLKSIKELQPEKIICLGFEALYTLIGHRTSSRISLTDKGYEKWVGWSIPDQDLKAWVFPVYSLDEVTKAKDDITANIFDDQIHNAISKGSFIENSYVKECSYIDNVEEAITTLRYFTKCNTPTSFDYETTGIKPHANGHEIICIGISNGIMSYGIPIFNDHKFLRALKRYLKSSNAKWGHNMQFEQTWTKIILGYFVNNWGYDSMIGSHILDNRSGITGLKFQSYVNFGIVGYDDSVDPYLKSNDDKNANAFNRLKEMDIKEVCTYCAIDAHLTWHLSAAQYVCIHSDRGFRKAYKLFHDGALTLAEISMNGMRVHEETVIENELILEKKLLAITKEINESEEAKLWDLPEQFNFNSPEHLGHLLYDLLEYSCTKFTDSGEKSTDVEALENISTDFTKKLLEYKRIYKIKNTYIAGIKRETVNGMIHPGFSLHLAGSYRSSSQNPNAQNYPKHDDYAMEMIRSCLGPHYGHFMVEADYSGAETRVSVDYNGDTKLYEYLFDPNTDMHRDVAADLFMKPPEEIDKEERFIAKNGITFAFFYGSSGYNAALRIWNSLLKDEHKAYFKTKGIKRFEDFVPHLENLHNIFWNERFKEYGQWKKDQWEFYKKYGYIKFKTGFKAGGRMYFNQTSNYQIQGSAFHCLLWSVIRVHNYFKEHKLNSKVIFQIHDSIGISVDPKEWTLIKPVIRDIMCIQLAQEWKWVKVPMRADFDFYEESWANEAKEEDLVA